MSGFFIAYKCNVQGNAGGDNEQYDSYKKVVGGENGGKHYGEPQQRNSRNFNF